MDRRWHLAQSAAEVDTTELEFALMRAFEGFGRWQTECLASVCDLAATGPENAMLHIIRMNDRPKSLKEIARLMNRDDVPNLQYSLRKLEAAGLISKSKDKTGKSFAYVVTEQGKQITDGYAAIRSDLLIRAIGTISNIDERMSEMTKLISVLTGIYEEMARSSTTYNAQY